MRFVPVIFCLLLLSCTAHLPPSPEVSETVLTGPLSRSELEASLPEWIEAMTVATVDTEAARALAEVEPGARVTVILGTWCSDSRREVSRLWRALDETFGLVPFEVRYHGVDRATLRSEQLVLGVDVEYVPTLVVERNGEESGRIVESAPHGTEHDLLALLRGDETGVISGRPELRREPGSR